MSQIDISNLFNPTTEESWLYKEYKKQSMAQQTAIDWLVEQVNKDCHISAFIPPDLIKKAKEMEKEQLNKACYDGYYEENLYDTRQYYDDTYGK